VSLAALAAHSCHAGAPPPDIDWGTHAAAAAAAAALAAGAPAPHPAHSLRGTAARADALCRAAGPALLRGALAVVARDGGSREAAAALAVLLARRGALCPLLGWRAEVRMTGSGVPFPVPRHDSLHTCFMKHVSLEMNLTAWGSARLHKHSSARQEPVTPAATSRDASWAEAAPAVCADGRRPRTSAALAHPAAAACLAPSPLRARPGAPALTAARSHCAGWGRHARVRRRCS
jgi:hypothetical protein